MGRTSGRPSGDLFLLRPALGIRTWHRHGRRAGLAVRPAGRGRAHDQPRSYRSRTRPGALHPACAGRPGMGHPRRIHAPRLPGAQRRRHGPGRPLGGQEPEPGPGGRKRIALRPLRPGPAVSDRVHPALREMVEEHGRRRPAPSRLGAVRCGARRHRPGPLSGRLAGVGDRAALHLRSWFTGRRRDGDASTARAGRAIGSPLLVAGARLPERAGHRAAPHPAQGTQDPPRPADRHRRPSRRFSSRLAARSNDTDRGRRSAPAVAGGNSDRSGSAPAFRAARPPTPHVPGSG